MPEIVGIGTSKPSWITSPPRFDRPHLSPQNNAYRAAVAQVVERSPEKAGVGGSTPSRGTIKSASYNSPTSNKHTTACAPDRRWAALRNPRSLVLPVAGIQPSGVKILFLNEIAGI